MDLRLGARLVVALVVGGFAAWMVALFVGLSSQSVTATVVLRTLLGLAIVVMLTRIVMRRGYDDGALTTKLLVAGLVSYLLSPAAWAGRALVAQIALDPGPATFILDLVLWVATVLVAGRTAPLRQAPVARAPYQVS